MGHHQRISDAQHVQEFFAGPTATFDETSDLAFDFRADLARL
jgi:hypothetical protein